MELKRREPSSFALGLAAQAWCMPETSVIVMDERLATEFARLLDTLLARAEEAERDAESTYVLIGEALRLKELAESERNKLRGLLGEVCKWYGDQSVHGDNDWLTLFDILQRYRVLHAKDIQKHVEVEGPCRCEPGTYDPCNGPTRRCSCGGDWPCEEK
jgi:hypothetical protein